MNELIVDTLARRLDRLERQNRRLKAVGVLGKFLLATDRLGSKP